MSCGPWSSANSLGVHASFGERRPWSGDTSARSCTCVYMHLRSPVSVFDSRGPRWKAAGEQIVFPAWFDFNRSVCCSGAPFSEDRSLPLKCPHLSTHPLSHQPWLLAREMLVWDTRPRVLQGTNKTLGKVNYPSNLSRCEGQQYGSAATQRSDASSRTRC